MNETRQFFWQMLPTLLALALFILFRHFFFYQTGDDSYIYFRYVERAVQGQWWSWSNHIPPVEGFSSPLWYGLLVLLAKWGVPVITAARYAGAFFALLSVAGAWVLARQLRLTLLQCGVVALLLVGNVGLNYWASAGLETSLYSALLVWSAIGLLRQQFWLLPTALLGVARPEGLFILLGILCGLGIFYRRQFSVPALLVCALPTLAYLLLRLLVYGQWLPNTFYAKATGEPMFQLTRGIIYGLPAWLPMLASLFLWWRYRQKEYSVLLGVTGLLLAIVIAGGGDWMFHFRLLVPLYAILIPLLAAQFFAVSVKARTMILVSAIPYLLTMMPPLYVMNSLLLQRLPEVAYQEGELTRESIALAADIRRQFPQAKLIAVNHAGALPWALPEYDMIDMVGLNDAHIARVKGKLHEKHDSEYVLGLKPDLIVLNSRVKPGVDGVWYHPGYWPGETDLVQQGGFQQYQPTALVRKWHWQVPFPYSLIENADTSWIMVYQRKQ